MKGNPDLHDPEFADSVARSFGVVIFLLALAFVVGSMVITGL